MRDTTLSKSEKALLIIHQLTIQKSSNKKVTVEDVAVALWKKYPNEFCMKGYPQYPNVDIQKYITKLLAKRLITGGVYNYAITAKGVEYAESLNSGKSKERAISIVETAELERNIRKEIERIVSSKLFRDYTVAKVEKKELDLLESDLFQFLGLTTRSLVEDKGKIFKDRYILVTKELVPFCAKKKDDSKALLIVELWTKLEEKFGNQIHMWFNGK